MLVRKRNAYHENGLSGSTWQTSEKGLLERDCKRIGGAFGFGEEVVKDLMDSEEIKVSAITKVFGCKEV